ncbi:hypothetical protein [Pyrodictium abyssi]|uniref:Uncharacterized protein n=1 Tax=Pyrodictium abyssi TaxID=54256 RepID=A0ABN6ZMP9_9CREN|nr:hypothetical protein PABY_11180 [Pyrodictium abyssi]
MDENRTCYSGRLLELFTLLGIPKPEDIEVPPVFEYALQSAYVVAEGDCGLLEELAARAKGAIREADQQRVSFETLLQMLLSIVDECSTRLTWGELRVALVSGDGRRVEVTVRGIPLEVLIALKMFCGTQRMYRGLQKATAAHMQS